jgi:hypothetical protein
VKKSLLTFTLRIKIKKVIEKYRAYNNRSTTMSWSALVLLVLYVFCSLHTDVIHRLSHAHELQDLHSIKNEKDQCHKSVYHHEKNSCEHKAHLTKSDKCSECQFSVERIKYLDSQQTAATVVHHNSFEAIVITFFVADFSIHTSDRAPPVI